MSATGLPQRPSPKRIVAHPYAPETAGHLMISRVPIARADEIVGGIKSRLATDDFQSRDLILGIDAEGRYAGAAALADVLLADDTTSLTAHLNADWPAVAAATDQEHAADVASKAGVTPLVVVGDDGRPLGWIPAARLLGVLAREHREDVHRLVGILKERDGARHVLDDPPLQRVRGRLPWLLVGLIMSTAGTALMASFEATLKAHVSIAFFIPALVYLADAIGTQTEAIAVRGLSLERRPLWRVLAGEAMTGALMGIVLGVLSFLGVLAVFKDARLATGVAISLFIAGSLASSLGLLLPWLLSRMGLDPAFGSGPVATIIQDVLTILVYFQVMTLLLAGA